MVLFLNSYSTNTLEGSHLETGLHPVASLGRRESSGEARWTLHLGGDKLIL